MYITLVIAARIVLYTYNMEVAEPGFGPGCVDLTHVLTLQQSTWICVTTVFILTAEQEVTMNY